MKFPLHILHIDPDLQDAQALAEHFRSHGLPYRMHHAADLAAARLLLRDEEVDAVVSDHLLPDGDAFSLLEGDGPDDATGKPLVQPLILATARGSEAVAARALRAGVQDYLVKDAAGRWLAQVAPAVEAAVGRQESQRQFHMLTHALMSITDAVFITDTAQTIIFVNKAFRHTYGYNEEDILGRHVSLLLADPAREADPSAQPHAARATREIFHRRKDGRMFPVSLSRSVIHDEKGLNMAIVGVARDISAWKQAEAKLTASLKEKEILLKEIHHRVKNNLQVISSLLNLQSGFLRDEQVIDALRDSQNRVKSMALIHERLYQSESLTKIDFGNYVRSLVSHVKSSFRGVGEVEVTVDVEEMLVDVDVAIPCGLIINELASNTFKHAFVGQREGWCRLVIGQGLDAAGHPEMRLEMEDSGRGYPPGLSLENAASLGLQLVNSLVQQLKGTIRLENQPGGGARVQAGFPLAD